MDDSVSVLGVASCVVQLGTSVLEVELLIFKKLLKSCLIGIDILANCPLSKESVKKLQETAIILKRKAASGFKRAFMSGTVLFKFSAFLFRLCN